MARVLCVANQKGGVGKTTSAINLAVGLAKGGLRTLLIDLDPQCNATTGLGMKPTDTHPLLEADRTIGETSKQFSQTPLNVLPGSRCFRDVELLTSGDPVSSKHVTTQIAAGSSVYDFVLIDCPPSIGYLTHIALSSADEVLMPIQCEYFAMEGLTQMIHVIRDVMRQTPGRLEFGGIVMTMYDHTLELSQEVEDEVREFFGEIVFDTVIPRDIAVSEAPSFGQSVIDHAPRSRGARAYIELCMEVMDRE